MYATYSSEKWQNVDFITEKLVASSGLFTMVGWGELWQGLLPIMLGAGVVIGILGSTMTIQYGAKTLLVNDWNSGYYDCS